MTPNFQWVYAPVMQPAPPVAERAPVSAAGSGRVEMALSSASSATGVPFDYLLRTAERESALDPSARAATSSATGLFQFIESTWIETLAESGDELGLQNYADAIERTPDGRYVVPDAEDRAEILALRTDPEIAALMAGALTVQNADYLQQRIGRAPDAGELYIAHFLGAAGAARLIEGAASTPDVTAADIFPRQAAANRPIFYGSGGAARSLSEVYANLVARHGGATPVDIAPASSAMAYAEPQALQPLTLAAERAFDGLFRTDGERGASAGTSFFNGFVSAPGMFDVALAMDAEAPAVTRAERERAPLPPPRSTPLDLSSFQATSW
jgi:hypothetical protein